MKQKRLSRFLNTCPPAVRQDMQEATFQPGDLFFCQGDVPHFLYILLEGEARVYHLTLNGIQVLEYIYGSGELFGEIEVLNGEPLLSDVCASTPCRALRLSRETLLAWMKADPDFALLMAEQLADKLYQACLHAAANIAYPLRYRVLYFLWHRVREGKRYIAKSDVISGVGSNERSINRILRELVGEHLLEYDAGTIRVPDLQKLAREMRLYE